MFYFLFKNTYVNGILQRSVVEQWHNQASAKEHLNKVIYNDNDLKVITERTTGDVEADAILINDFLNIKFGGEL
jgi:hypothetical protein